MNAIYHPFVHDDVVFIESNPYLDDLNLKNIFSRSSFFTEKLELVNTYYRPVLDVFNGIINKLFGRNPHAFHFINIILHILNACLLFVIVRLCTSLQNQWSFLVSLIFLVHPVQTEAVACVSGISNLLSTFLMLNVFLLFLLAEKDSSKRLLYYGMSLLLFVIALLTKEQAVVLPVIMLGYVWIKTNEKNQFLKRAFGKLSAYFILLAGYFLLRRILFGSMITKMFDNLPEFLLRMQAFPRTLLLYLKLSFFPHDLHYYRIIDFLDPNGLAAVIFLLILTFAIIFISRQEGEVKAVCLFGCVWYFVSLLPVSNIVPLINEYSLLMAGEHFLYFPVIGLILAVVFVYQDYHRTRVRLKRLTPIFWSAIIGIFIFMTVIQNTFWRSEVVLFERTMKYEEGFGRGHLLLGTAYYEERKFNSAVVEFKKALTIFEGYLKKTKKVEAVEQFYTRFIVQSHAHLAHAYEGLGELENSLNHYKEVSEFEPQNPIASFHVGRTYVKLNDLKNAAVYFKQAVNLAPDFYMAMNHLALCYKELGRYQEAEKLFREIVENDPQSDSARQNLKNIITAQERK